MNFGQFISECVYQAGIKHDDSRVTRQALAQWANKSIINFFTETELCKDETIGFVAGETNAINLSDFIFYDEPQQSPSVIIVPESYLKTNIINETFSANGGTGFDIPSPFWNLYTRYYPTLRNLAVL